MNTNKHYNSIVGLKVNDTMRIKDLLYPVENTTNNYDPSLPAFSKIHAYIFNNTVFVFFEGSAFY